MSEQQPDERYVYSACCTWHGPIQEASAYEQKLTISGRDVVASIPGCPHCGSPLYEYPTRARWDEQMAKFAADHPELPLYVEWIESFRTGPCTQTRDFDWLAAYNKWAGRVQ